jgi:hypothetical protein
MLLLLCVYIWYRALVTLHILLSLQVSLRIFGSYHYFSGWQQRGFLKYLLASRSAIVSLQFRYKEVEGSSCRNIAPLVTTRSKITNTGQQFILCVPHQHQEAPLTSTQMGTLY